MENVGKLIPVTRVSRRGGSPLWQVYGTGLLAIRVDDWEKCTEERHWKTPREQCGFTVLQQKFPKQMVMVGDKVTEDGAEGAVSVSQSSNPQDSPQEPAEEVDPATLTWSDVDEDWVRMACPAAGDGSRARDDAEDEESRNVRRRTRGQDGPRPPGTPPPRRAPPPLVQGHTPVYDADVVSGHVHAIVDPAQPPPHNPFDTLENRDFTKSPHPDTLYHHFKKYKLDGVKLEYSIILTMIGLRDLEELLYARLDLRSFGITQMSSMLMSDKKITHNTVDQGRKQRQFV